MLQVGVVCDCGIRLAVYQRQEEAPVAYRECTLPVHGGRHINLSTKGVLFFAPL
jgi:hypothetical protein